MPHETPYLQEGLIKKGGQNPTNTSKLRPLPPGGSRQNYSKEDLTNKLVSACKLLELLGNLDQLPADVQSWWESYKNKHKK